MYGTIKISYLQHFGFCLSGVLKNPSRQKEKMFRHKHYEETILIWGQNDLISHLLYNICLLVCGKGNKKNCLEHGADVLMKNEDKAKCWQNKKTRKKSIFITNIWLFVVYSQAINNKMTWSARPLTGSATLAEECNSLLSALHAAASLWRDFRRHFQPLIYYPPAYLQSHPALGTQSYFLEIED